MKTTTATPNDKEMTTTTDTTTTNTNNPTTNTPTTNLKHYEVPDKIKHLTKEEEEKHIKYWNKRIEYQQLKRGIHKSKDDYLNSRYKKYVREENKLRDIFKHRPDLLPHNQPTADAPGKKKPDRHTYPTTNKEMWDNNINERYGIENPEIQFLHKQREEELAPTTPTIPTKYLRETTEKPVIIYDGDTAQFYQARIHPYNHDKQDIYVWRKHDARHKVKVKVEPWSYNDENMDREIDTPIGKITLETLLKTTLTTDATIYRLLHIYSKQPKQPQQPAQQEGEDM